MAASGDPDGKYHSGDPQADANAPHEPLATEPLQRVGTEGELVAETIVDKDFAEEIDTSHDSLHEVELNASQTSSSVDGEQKQKRPALLARGKSSRTTITSTASGMESVTPFKTGSRWRWLTFKRRHPPPVPAQRAECREGYANLLSIITFQWIYPIMRVGYQRPIEHNDLWTVNKRRSADYMTEKVKAAFKRRVEKGGKRPLIRALFDVFKFEFILGGMCQLTSQVIQVANPFILRYLITFAGEAYFASIAGTPGPPIGRGIGLVFAVTILQMIQSSCTNQYIYRGMMNGGQARAVLIAMIFDKSTRISGRARAGGSKLLPSHIKPGSEEEKEWFKENMPGMQGDGAFSKRRKGPLGLMRKKKKVQVDEDGYSNGRITNLMSVDSYRIDQACGMFHMIWTAPIGVVIVLVLLLINITYSALPGFGFILIMMPGLHKSIRLLFKRRRAINKITDQRVSLSQEILQAIRFVKLFGWETSFLDRIKAIRDKEIGSIQILLAIRNGINAISMSMPIFASMLSFITYALSSHDLNPALIFSSLGLFNSLRLPLNLLPLVIGQVIDGASSAARIEEFLLAEEIEDRFEWDSQSENAVEVQGASFTWERVREKEEKKKATGAEKGRKKTGKDKKEKKLSKEKEQQVTEKALSPPSPAASDQGQTPFSIDNLNFSVARNELIAVIGSVGSGKSSLLSALAGDMRMTGGHIKFGASRAFCPQYAWIQNATVKQNILFGKEMNHRWYDAVIDACALRPDLEMLPNGDLTEIGERGITVSGGQKQRLNIARAIYFDSDVVLLDDPLSAVDAHVGRHIMDNAICGLLKHKCRILATHQLWVLNRCDRIIWMHEGRIAEVDTFENLMANNAAFGELIAQNAQEERVEKKVDGDEIEEEKKTKKTTKKPKAALMQAEERAVKSVSWSVYKAYIKASGSLYVFPLILLLLITSQGANICTSLWLSWWTSNKFGFSTGLYIGVYAALGVVQAFLFFLFSVSLSIFGTQASKIMLHAAMTRVLRAPMSFFDTTPLGRITNRFSKDVDTMDNTLTDAIRMFAITMGMIVSVFILIIVYYYFFAVALGPLFILFIISAGFYRASAREIKRHESVLRSHVFARFGEAVSGISTIRAYGLEKQFSKSIRDAIDDMNSAYYLTFANQRWLSVRLDVIGNLLVFVVGILVVTSRFSINPSTGGLVLSYILSIVQMIQFTVRQLAEVENNMNATERVHYYATQLDEEPPLRQRELPESWPTSGEIEFNNVQMRYRDGLPLVLKGLSMHVQGGERIGIVGRTGAGKSSIIGTLFRLTELSGGNITIDGVDITSVGLHDLRSRISIIPQDPTLFKGTIRSNLDPFNRYSDLELWNALRQADLIGEDAIMEDRSQRIHLDSAVEEEGMNFSLGQRQMMALARALVRNSQIIVCDEATSSVDMETDQKIQRTIASGFKGKTLLCIAHRLRTIINYDRICVMDNGQIAELDTPIRLFEQGGIFSEMCKKSSITREDFSSWELEKL